MTLIRTSYNVVWWSPIALVLLDRIDYGTGFIAFIAITVMRLSANWYLNNVLPTEQFENFPFRA